MINRQALLNLVDRAERGALLPGEASILRDAVLLLDDFAATLDKIMSSEQMADYWQKWVEKYPIRSIEDGFAENDWAGWKLFTDRVASGSSQRRHSYQSAAPRRPDRTSCCRRRAPAGCCDGWCASSAAAMRTKISVHATSKAALLETRELALIALLSL